MAQSITNKALISTSSTTDLLIVGNGFDLRCGLKTSYNDFINYILDKIFKGFDEIHEYSGDTILEKVMSLFDSCLQNQIQKYSLPTDISKKFNLWYAILIDRNLQKTANWNSIEDAIYNFLTNKSVNNLERAFKDIHNTIQWYPSDPSPYSLANKIYYLLREIILCKYGENDKYSEFIEKVYQDPSSLKDSLKVDLYTILKSELESFENDFQRYINYIMNSSAEGNNDNQRVNDIKTTVELAGNSTSPTYLNIITFNYTGYWERLKSAIPYINNIHYVHGLAGSCNTQTPEIIFGIDSTGIDKSSPIYPFTKEYRTFSLYTKPSQNIYTSNPYPDKVRNIHIYGHSLAPADYGYFRMIFTKYKDDPNTRFWFHYSTHSGLSAEKIHAQQVTAISALFDRYTAESPENQFLFQDLIQTGRIKINEIS